MMKDLESKMAKRQLRSLGLPRLKGVLWHVKYRTPVLAMAVAQIPFLSCIQLLDLIFFIHFF